MYFFNYIFFVIITYVGIRFLMSDGRIVKNPLNPDRWIKFDGVEMFWVLTFSTGLLALSAPAGLDLMALRLMVLEVLCLVGLFVVKNKPVWSIPLVVYTVYLLWNIIGCFYSPVPSYGIRVFLKYLYPLLIALFASAAVRNAEVFIKAGLEARFVAVLSLIYYFLPGFSSIMPGVFWYGTAGAIHFISIIVFSLALFYYTNEKRKNLIYVIVFILPCFIWVFRTSIMGTALALMTFFFFKYRLRSFPVIVGILMLAVALVFAVPSIREKMFRNSDGKNVDMLYSGQISADDIDSNGRFAMWEWAMDKFYKGNELRGSGTGNLQETFYALRHPFAQIRICHNDYVQILCDNGLIGIVLFGSSFVLIIMHCFMIFQNRRYPIYIKLCAITAGSSLAGMILAMFTDNVVNYTMATLSMPLGFYGMTLGLIRGINEKRK